MNIIELMYLNMKPFDEVLLNNVGFELYIREHRTLRMDSGRATGKTLNLCELAVKYDFKDVAFICHNSNIISNTRKTIELYNNMYKKNKNIEFMSCNNLLEDKFRGRKYDVIIFDAYSYYKSKINFNYILSLKKDGIVVKVG